MNLRRPLVGQRERREQADGAAADDERARLAQGSVDGARRQIDRMQRGGGGLGEGGVSAVHALGNVDQVLRRHRYLLGERTRPVHADEVALGTDVGTPAEAVVTAPAVDQRVDDDAAPAAGAGEDDARGFVPEDQRRHPTRVVTEIRVHVRAADADGLDADDGLAFGGSGIGLVAQLHALVRRVHQCLHGRGTPTLR